MNFNKFFSEKEKEQELNEGLMMLEMENRLEMIFLSTELTDSLMIDSDNISANDEVMY